MEEPKNSAPAYSEYPTELPPTFSIGAHKFTPLVTVTELEAHLRILGAFHGLRDTVESQPGLAEKDKDAAWAVFVARAVHRFESWVKGAPAQLPPDRLPAIDILMVWHAYLLNPRAFYEDCRRIPENVYLSSRLDLPLIEYADVLSKGDSMLKDAPLVTTTSDQVQVSCPNCYIPHLVSWINDTQTGYAERQFQAKCNPCGTTFDKEALGVMKFCSEVRTKTPDSQTHFLSGTLLDPLTGVETLNRAQQFNKGITKTFDGPSLNTLPAPGLAKAMNFKMSRVEETCRGAVLAAGVGRNVPTPRRILKILKAYRHPGLASIELSGAVIRQGSFIKKMVKMGWTTPGRFDSDGQVAVLVRSIARYHAFLDLMSTGPSSFFVPTLDIDLAWHTHQLKGTLYRTETLQYLRRIPDHDDAIEESTLSIAYDVTARAWKARFGVPYSICGCAPDAVSSNPISKLASKIFRTGEAGTSKAASGKLNNARPDLISPSDGDADATHPSEHNSVIVVGDKLAELRGKIRKDDVERRAHEAEKYSKKAMEKGKAETWTDIQVKNREKSGDDHQEAFARITPYWGVSAFPYGYYGTGACVAFGGGVILASSGNCAAGAGTGGSCSAGGGANCSNLVGGSYCAASLPPQPPPGSNSSSGCGGGGGGCGGGCGGCGGCGG